MGEPDGSTKPADSRVANLVSRQWPLILAVLLGVWGYFDLKADVERVRESFRGEVSSAHHDSSDQAWDCAGLLQSEQVRTVIGREGHSVFGCFGERTAEDSHLTGGVEVQLRVNESGAVTDARYAGSLAADDVFTACLDPVVRSWRFPEPTGGACAVVSAPFMLGGVPGAPVRD